MKGCLSSIFKSVIAILVFFGLVHIGAIDFLKNKISEYNGISIQKTVEKTKDSFDLSNINEEYKINKSFDIMNNILVTAEHKATGQKMILIETAKGDLLTQEDIKGEGLEEKIKNLTSEYNNKFLKFDEPRIIKKGEFYGINQEIPYAKFTAKISNLPLKEIEGIIGVAVLKNGGNLTVMSYNENGKYSQIITEAFYKSVE